MGTQRQRRTFSAEVQARVGLEVVTGQKTAAQVCREHRLKPDLLSRWKAAFVTHASSVFSGDEREQQAECRSAEVERLVGRLALELEGAKKAAVLSSGTRNGS
jgi:transposase-like protein